jgi:hypothetical protein
MQSVLKRYNKEHRDYVPQGDSALTPLELIDIRRFMLTYDDGNAKLSLALWTGFLVGCTAFLRAQELTSIKISDFVLSLSLIDGNGVVQRLAVEIVGKDGQLHTVVLWRNDPIPELCPIRHLLAYISLCDIRSGYLFRANLSNPNDPIPYQYLNDR